MKFVPKGIIPPIITPLTDEGEVNYPVLRQMVNNLIENGVHGLFPLGTTGEFYAFDNDTYRKILETVKEETAGRVPVYGGANHITTRGVIELIKICEEVGVDAVSVLTPMFVSQTQDELYDYFATIAASTTLPIILYNIPSRTGVNMSVDTVKTLARKYQNIVALKQSFGDMDVITELKMACPNDFAIYSGDDSLTLPMLSVGAHGVISVASHIFGKEIKSMIRNFKTGDSMTARNMHQKLYPIFKKLFMAPNPVPVKAALAYKGLIEEYVRKPLVPLTKAEKTELLFTLDSI